MPSEQKEFEEYLDAGLSPIPLKEGAKRPAISNWQGYCDRQPTQDEIAKWSETYDLNQIGIALGTRISNDHVLVAIDVDDDELLEPVWAEIGLRDAPAKIGKKGITIFARADKSIKNAKIRRKNKDGKASRKPAIEILAHGAQTVVPPSVHPETQDPYRWVTTPLVNGFPNNLPVLDEFVLDALTAICESKAEKLEQLNSMVWAGVDGGGDTHDSCVEAVAWMVSRGWSDTAVHRRIERAKKESVERSGEDYNWPESTKTIQGWVDSARSKGFEEDGKKAKAKKPPAERVMAEWGVEFLGGQDNVVCNNGALRSYKNGYWPVVNTDALARAMYNEDYTLRKRDVENAISIIHTLMYQDNFGSTEGLIPSADPKRKRICLTNGTYDINTGELIPHDREHQLCHQLPFGWEDEAANTLYTDVVSTTLAGDPEAIQCWNEFCALTLVNDMSFQVAMVLKGPGGNGKGTLASVVLGMHDPDAVGSVSITDLGDERKRTSLINKLINVSGEQSRLNLVSDIYFKKITGGDPIDCRRLFGEVMNNVYLWTRFLEMVNEMPSTSDTSHALRRRLRVLPCPNKIVNPNPNLKELLMLERPAILKQWVTQDLPNLYERGVFLNPKCSKEEVDQYMLDNDPVGAWMNEVVEPCDQGTLSGELYGGYRDWSDTNGYRTPYTSVFWGKKMNDLGFPVVVSKMQGRSVRVRKCKIRQTHGIKI